MTPQSVYTNFHSAPFLLSPLSSAATSIKWSVEASRVQFLYNVQGCERRFMLCMQLCIEVCISSFQSFHFLYTCLVQRTWTKVCGTLTHRTHDPIWSLFFQLCFYLHAAAVWTPYKRLQLYWRQNNCLLFLTFWRNRSKLRRKSGAFGVLLTGYYTTGLRYFLISQKVVSFAIITSVYFLKKLAFVYNSDCISIAGFYLLLRCRRLFCTSWF